MAAHHVSLDHAFLRGLASRQIKRLAEFASVVNFEQDEIILLNGQRSQFFYLILTGSVAVELRTPRFAVCVQALGADQAFGWSALLDDQDTVFLVRARERTTALQLDGACLAQAFAADPELGIEFLRRTLKLVAGRVKATEMKFAEMCGVRVTSGAFASGGLEI